jgi:eukaryotic translation initiation factor 2C
MQIIDKYEFKDMVKECMRSHVQIRNKLPSKVIFYRDGVSQGQYSEFRDQEVRAIEEAWDDLKEGNPTWVPTKLTKATRGKIEEEKLSKVPITAIVGEKRHHTRFYAPEDQPHLGESKTWNCKFGTFVEIGPTSSYYFDFYLQAHHGLTGTAKPTHYFVVKDHNKFTADQLLNLVSFSTSRSLVPYDLTNTDQQSLIHLPASYHAGLVCSSNLLR